MLQMGFPLLTSLKMVKTSFWTDPSSPFCVLMHLEKPLYYNTHLNIHSRKAGGDGGDWSLWVLMQSCGISCETAIDSSCEDWNMKYKGGRKRAKDLINELGEWKREYKRTRVLSGEGEKKEKQIISQQRIELKWDRRREWVKKEKEIMKQHRRGMKETKYNKTKGKKEQAQRKQEGEEKHDEIRGKIK